MSAASITIVGAGASALGIARRCVEAGLGVTLAVRRREAGERIASQLVGPGDRPKVTSVDLGDDAGLDQLFEGAGAVVNTAGPFVETAPPLVASALRTGTPYIDLANEVLATRDLLARAEDAREREAVLVTGAGFGVAAAELAAMHLGNGQERIVEIEIANAPEVSYSTAGVAQTVIESLPAGGYLVRGGRLQRSRLGSPVRRIPLPSGQQRAGAVPTGDLIAVHNITGASAVTLYSTEFPSGLAARLAMRPLAIVLRITPLRRRLRRLIRSRAGAFAPSQKAPSGRPSVTWARASYADGSSRETVIRLGEGYEVTARVAFACIGAAIEGAQPGAWTPGGLLGSALATACGASFEEVDR